MNNLTIKEMCELAARYLYDTTGKHIEPGDLYRLSPSGELAPVFALYWQACAYYGQYTHEALPDIATMNQGDLSIIPEGEYGAIHRVVGQSWLRMYRVLRRERSVMNGDALTPAEKSRTQAVHARWDEKNGWVMVHPDSLIDSQHKEGEEESDG